MQPSHQQAPPEEEEVAPVVIEAEAFTAFGGSGNVLGRRRKKDTSDSAAGAPNVIVKGPDLEFKIGKIMFTRTIPVKGAANGVESAFKAFEGSGMTIKQKRKK